MPLKIGKKAAQVSDPKSSDIDALEIQKQKEHQDKLMRIFESHQKRLEDERKRYAERKKQIEEETLQNISDEQKNLEIRKQESIERINKDYNSRIQQMKALVLNQIPQPSLKFVVYKENAPMQPKQSEPVFSFSFSRDEYKSLQAMRDHQKTYFYFIKKANSPQYEAAKNALNSFLDKYDDFTIDFGKDQDVIASQLKDMRTQLENIKEQASKYVTHNSKRKIHSETGKQRFANMKSLVDMMTEKLKSLDDIEKALPEMINTQNQARKAEEERREAEIKEEFETLKTSAINSDDTKSSNRIKRYKESEKYDLSQNDLKNEINLKSYSATKTKKVFGSFSKEEQYSIICAKLANSIFEQKYNPFSDYRTSVEDVTIENHQAFNPSNRENTVNLNELKQALFNNKDGEFPITFTSDALITLNNLRTFDILMGVSREKNDFQVEFMFEKDGQILDAKAINEIGAEKLKEDGYRCFVTAIHADPKALDKNEPFSSRAVTSTTARMDDNGVINHTTAMNLLNFDATLLNDTLFSLNTDSFYSTAKDFFKERIKDLSQSISLRKRNTIASIKFSIEKTMSIKKQVAGGQLDYRLTRPAKKLKEKVFYKPGLVRNTPNYYDEDLIGNLRLNRTRTVSMSDQNISKDIKDKILSETSLPLLNKDLISPKLSDALKTDPELAQLQNKLLEVQKNGVDAALEHNTLYVTENGVTAQPPQKGEYISSTDYLSQYDKDAEFINSQIKEYTEKHKADLSNPNSTASMLKQWSENIFMKGNLTIDPANKNALPPINETDDADYLLIAEGQLANNLGEFWNSDETLAKHNGMDKPKIVLRDMKDVPLFTKKPSPADITQGNIGDCYFLASIASLAAEDPDAIMNMMKDNGDTVTCRFYNQYHEEINVTVSKKLAEVQCDDPQAKGKLMPTLVSGENGPLWYHILAKAYMKSGLREETSYKDKSNRDSFLENNRTRLGLEKDADEEDIMEQTVLAYKKNALDNIPDESKKDEVKRIYEKLYHKSFCALEGGFMHNVYHSLTGNRSVEKSLQNSKSNILIAALEKFNSQVLVGNRLDSLNNKEKARMEKITKFLAEKFRMEKTKFTEDEEGKEYTTYEHISLDELSKELKEIKDHPELITKKASEQQEIAKCAEKLEQNITEHQMNDKDQEFPMYSSKEGVYSKYANEIFDLIKANVNAKNHIGASFSGKTAFVKKEDNELGKVLFDNQAMTSDGLVTEHAYTVLDCDEDPITHVKYVTLRNPWKSGEASTNTVTIRTKDGEEEISYEGLRVDDLPENDRSSGLMRVELNTFMRNVQDLDLTSKEKAYSRSQINKSLATQYLDMMKKNYSAQYTKLIPTEKEYDIILNKTANSEMIKSYTDKILKIENYRNSLLNGDKLPEEAFKTIKNYENELNEFVNKTAPVIQNADKSKQQELDNNKPVVGIKA